MPKHRGKSRKHKSRKRAAAARKAWRTRKRKYGTRGRKRGRKQRKHSSKKRWRRGIIGGWYHERSFKWKPKRKKKRKLSAALRAFNRANPPRRCSRCGKTVFGGSKGMSTHHKRHHRR